jgi:hypothetical protein
MHQRFLPFWPIHAHDLRCTLPFPMDDERDLNRDLDEGVAGASARATAERRRASREAKTTARWGRRFGRVVLAVKGEPQSTRAWDQGARGEERLAATLADIHGVRVLHDRRVKGTKANIDHVVIAPVGVFVVDAKNYRGTIRVRDVGGWVRQDLRLYVGNRDRSKLAEGLLWQVTAVVDALAGSGVDPLPSVIPVLCFVDGEWPLLFPPKEYKGVRLEGLRSIRRAITGTETLDQASIDDLTQILATALPAK